MHPIHHLSLLVYRSKLRYVFPPQVVRMCHSYIDVNHYFIASLQRCEPNQTKPEPKEDTLVRRWFDDALV